MYVCIQAAMYLCQRPYNPIRCRCYPSVQDTPRTRTHSARSSAENRCSALGHRPFRHIFATAHRLTISPCCRGRTQPKPPPCKKYRGYKSYVAKLTRSTQCISKRPLQQIDTVHIIYVSLYMDTVYICVLRVRSTVCISTLNGVLNRLPLGVRQVPEPASCKTHAVYTSGRKIAYLTGRLHIQLTRRRLCILEFYRGKMSNIFFFFFFLIHTLPCKLHAVYTWRISQGDACSIHSPCCTAHTVNAYHTGRELT